MRKMQCKDIPDLPVLEFLRDLPIGGVIAGKPYQIWAVWFWTPKGTYEPNPEYEFLPINSVARAMPLMVGDKLRRAKMAMLIRRGLVDGCPCGCRGDYQLTDKGRAFIEKATA